jgi:hypothetical protein
MLLGRCVTPGQVQIKGALTNHKDVFRVSATGEVEEDEDEDEGTPSFMSQVLRPPPHARARCPCDSALCTTSGASGSFGGVRSHIRSSRPPPRMALWGCGRARARALVQGAARARARRG